MVPDSLDSTDLGQGSVRSSELGGFHTHSDTVQIGGGTAENGAYNTAPRRSDARTESG